MPIDGDASNHPIKLEGWARTADSKKWRRMVRVQDRDSQNHLHLVDSVTWEDRRRLFAFLSDRGCAVPADKISRDTLYKTLVASPDDDRFLLVDRVGWHGKKFLLGPRALGGGRERIILDEESLSMVHMAGVAESGTLQEWQAHVAGLCLESSYLVLALSLAFAAPLLRLMSISSGGIHIFAGTSHGKSTSQLVAGSLFGSGRVGGYVQSWAQTLAALEERALGHCDLPLILDEIHLIDQDPARAAQSASHAAYIIANGIVKGRSSRYTGAISVDPWHTLIISSGELSLAEHARAGGRRRLMGEEARMLDIPIPNTPTGIFDRLLPSATGQDSRLRVDQLQIVAGRYYGVAGRVFLENVIADLAKSQTSLVLRLRGWMNDFYRAANVDMTDGFEVRRAERIAVGYAAGRYSIAQGVLPWQPALLLDCQVTCYKRASGARDLAVMRKRNIEWYRYRLSVLRCQLRLNRKARVAGQQVHHKRDADGWDTYAVAPRSLASLCEPTIRLNEMVDLLERVGWIMHGSDGKRTRQLQISGTRRRCYFIRPQATHKLKESDLV